MQSSTVVPAPPPAPRELPAASASPPPPPNDERAFVTILIIVLIAVQTWGVATLAASGERLTPMDISLLAGGSIGIFASGFVAFAIAQNWLETAIRISLYGCVWWVYLGFLAFSSRAVLTAQGKVVALAWFFTLIGVFGAACVRGPISSPRV